MNLLDAEETALASDGGHLINGASFISTAILELVTMAGRPQIQERSQISPGHDFVSTRAVQIHR